MINISSYLLKELVIYIIINSVFFFAIAGAYIYLRNIESDFISLLLPFGAIVVSSFNIIYLLKFYFTMEKIFKDIYSSFKIFDEKDKIDYKGDIITYSYNLLVENSKINKNLKEQIKNSENENEKIKSLLLFIYNILNDTLKQEKEIDKLLVEIKNIIEKNKLLVDKLDRLQKLFILHSVEDDMKQLSLNLYSRWENVKNNINEDIKNINLLILTLLLGEDIADRKDIINELSYYLNKLEKGLSEISDWVKSIEEQGNNYYKHYSLKFKNIKDLIEQINGNIASIKGSIEVVIFEIKNNNDSLENLLENLKNNNKIIFNNLKIGKNKILSKFSDNEENKNMIELMKEETENTEKTVKLNFDKKK